MATVPIITSNNPAGRLHALVEKIRKMPNDARAGATITSLPAVLGMRSETSRPVLMQMFGEILGLPLEIEQAIGKLPDIKKPHVYLSWIGNAKAAFNSCNLDQPINNFLTPFDANTMSLLEICDEVLGRLHVEPVVDAKNAENLLKETRELIAATMAAVIDEQTREFVLRHLYVIEQSIIESQYFGIRSLRRAVETTVGATFVGQQQARDVAQTPLGKHLCRVLAGLVLLSSGINDIAQLPTSLKNVYQLFEPKQLPASEDTRPPHGSHQLAGNSTPSPSAGG